MNVILALYMACLLQGSLSSSIMSKNVLYKDIDKAPNPESRIITIYNIRRVEACLIKCSEEDACKCIVYEGTTCYLHNSSVGTTTVQPGQKAVAEFSVKAIYGEPPWKNLIRINHIAKCSASSAYMPYSCDKLMDGNLATSWMTNTNAQGQWVKLEFTRTYEVHAIDLWSNIGIQGQCRVLTFTFSNDNTETKQRQCVDGNGSPAMNQFEINPVITTYIKMTCVMRCYPEGWYVHYELAVYVRR